MQKSKYVQPARIPPRPQSSRLYGHGSRDYANKQIGREVTPKVEHQPKMRGHLPGYTGFVPKHLHDDIHELQLIAKRDSRFNVPGYQGFVPQIKAENVYGTSFAKSSGMARQG